MITSSSESNRIPTRLVKRYQKHVVIPYALVAILVLGFDTLRFSRGFVFYNLLDDFLMLAIPIALYALIVAMVCRLRILSRAWNHAKLDPSVSGAAAVGRLFIPVIGLIWAPQLIVLLATGFNSKTSSSVAPVRVVNARLYAWMTVLRPLLVIVMSAIWGMFSSMELAHGILLLLFGIISLAGVFFQYRFIGDLVEAVNRPEGSL